MFKRLQFKMTIYYTLILITILVVTNLSIYFFMVNYNNYQIANETQYVLESIQSSEWLYDTESSTTTYYTPVLLSDSDDDDELEDDEESSEDDDDDSPSDDDSTENDDVLPTDNDIIENTENTVNYSVDAIEEKIPEIDDLIIPRMIETFPYYMIYDDSNVLKRSKGDNNSKFTELENKTSILTIEASSQIIEIETDASNYYLLIKMPIVIAETTIGSYAIVKDVTLAFETMENLVKILIYSFIGGVLVSLIVGFLMAGKTLKPIKKAYDSKQVFLANASHELKTPLSIIMLSTETLEGEIDESETFQRKIISGIKDESVRMSDLVSNLLYLSRRDNQGIVNSVEEFDISELLLLESKKYETLALSKQITIERDLDEYIGFVGDKNQLTSAFGILIDNAVKYTPSNGRVIIKVKRSLISNRYNTTIEITDTGVGIPIEEQDKIFERFYRLDTSRSKETGGHGLGLSIAKEIIEMHDGTIQINSIEGVGTTFRIDFITKQ